MHKPLSFAKTLRRNMTDAEKTVWSFLRNHQSGHKFRRQQPLGPYVGDFVCFEHKLVVEIDGGQHTPEKDAVRTKYLEEKGYHIIRFWNNEVLTNRDGVYDAIDRALNTPHPNPLPQGEREPLKETNP